MLPAEVIAEFFAFVDRFDLSHVSLVSVELRKISEKLACDLRLWELGCAVVKSCWDDMDCDFCFSYPAREEWFRVDSHSAKEIIPIEMRNVVVKQCYFQCLHGVHTDGCILSAYSEIADRIVVTGSLRVAGKCLDSTEK